MKNQLLAIGLLLASNAALATVINFDNTAPADSITPFGTNGSYAESGFTLTATGNTRLYTFDPVFNPSGAPSQNGTDFGYFVGGTQSVSLTAASPFSLQSFNAANLNSRPAGNLTLTGHVSGGAILSAVLSTLGGDQWSLFSLTGWNNLTSVDIVAQSDEVGLDNITVNAPVPEPSVLWLFMSGLAGLSRRWVAFFRNPTQGCNKCWVGTALRRSSGQASTQPAVLTSTYFWVL